jgi:hypothetical protein
MKRLKTELLTRRAPFHSTPRGQAKRERYCRERDATTLSSSEDSRDEVMPTRLKSIKIWGLDPTQDWGQEQAALLKDWA